MGGVGIPSLDDWSIRRVLQAVAPLQQRHYVVMEVKSNWLKEERAALLARFEAFKKVAVVIVGEPTLEFKKHTQRLNLKQKQEASNAEFRAKQAEEKKKSLLHGEPSKSKEPRRKRKKRGERSWKSSEK